MKTLSRILAENEIWLVRRILSLAKAHDYTRYTSTLEEAWRLSIQGLSQSLILGVESFGGPPDFGPDDKFVADPLTDFGVIEAKRHRDRGVTLTMFLGLMKYYKQAYVDLLDAQQLSKEDCDRYREIIERSFDRIEIAFVSEWVNDENAPIMETLQTKAREMTNEKNAYLTVLESLSDAVIMLDEEGLIIHMNHAAASLTDPSHVPGSPYHQLQNPDATTPSDVQSSWPTRRSSKQPFAEVFPWLESSLAAVEPDMDALDSGTIEVMIRGELRSFEIRHARMLDVSEKFLAHILTLRDITERRRIDAMLTKRTLEIERLRHWESLGMLASGIAHDFNNLLAAIDGRCRIIRKRISSEDEVPGDDEVIRLSVRYILDAVDKGVELTRTMRACSGRDVGWASHQDLSAIVRQWAEDLTLPIPPHVQLVVEADTSLPGVPLNQSHVWVILSNLLTNAVEALSDDPSGRIVVRTGVAKRQIPQGYQSLFVRETSFEQFVFVEVEDNGSGIDEADLPKIMDPFFSTKFIGRGLGLAAVRGAASAHRGAVLLRTDPGKGSAFQVRFPVEPPSEEPQSIST